MRSLFHPSGRSDGTHELRGLHGSEADCQFAMFILGMLVGFLMLVVPARAVGVINDSARTELVKTLAAMGKVKSIQSAFVCEKKLQVLQKPFFSRGIFTIARPLRVRFQTNWPYRSCYILNGRDIDMRNESDSRWSAGTVNSHPTIGIIMRQFAAWSLGNAEKVSAQYQITMKSALRPVPTIPDAVRSAPSANHGAANPSGVRLFTLLPRRGVLKRAIREIQLGFTARPANHRHRSSMPLSELRFIRIVSKNGDTSSFWLLHTTLNPRLTSHCFAPVGPA